MTETTEFATKNDILNIYAALASVLEVAVIAFYAPHLKDDEAKERFEAVYREAVTRIRTDIGSLDLGDKNV